MMATNAVVETGSVPTTISESSMTDWTKRVVHLLLREQARVNPEKRFLKSTTDWITFREMDNRSDRVAAGLAANGVTKGDRVVVIMANRDEFFEIFFACAKLGAVCVSLNTFLKGETLRFQIVDSAANIAIVDVAGWKTLQPVIAQTELKNLVVVDPVPATDAVISYSVLRSNSEPPPATSVDAADPIAIIYTSGTTGLPKGCILSNGYYTNSPYSYINGQRIIPGDRIYTAFPLFHAAGQVMLMMSGLVAPAEIFFVPSFHASTFIRDARREGASVVWGVGAMAMAILAQPPQPDDASQGFRLAAFQPLPVQQQLEFERRFATPVVTEGYGQTECVPITTSKVSDPRRRDSIGRPVDHLDVRIVDERGEEVPLGTVGEIIVRPRRPNVMFQGYWKRPEATVAASRNLWHHTGDHARQDSDGYIYFVDRKQDAIRRRGENISSYEIENTLTAHPDIAEAAAHAVPSQFSEDEVKVVIVFKKGATLTPAQLFEYCKDRLPYFSMPRYVEVSDSLPRNGMGKVEKQVLRQRGLKTVTWDFEALGLVVKKQERRS